MNTVTYKIRFVQQKNTFWGFADWNEIALRFEGAAPKNARPAINRKSATNEKAQLKNS